MYAALQIRKSLSRFHEKQVKYIWNDLSPETKQAVKQGLFILLEQTPDKATRSSIADAIGDIGGALYDENAKVGVDPFHEWPEIPNNIFKLIVSDKKELIESGFMILSQILTYTADGFLKYKEQLKERFKFFLTNNNLTDLQLGAMQSLGSMLEVLDPDDCKFFEELCIEVLKAAYNIVMNDENSVWFDFFALFHFWHFFTVIEFCLNLKF